MHLYMHLSGLRSGSTLSYSGLGWRVSRTLLRKVGDARMRLLILLLGWTPSSETPPNTCKLGVSVK
jgi:hypothetical protein